MRASALLLVLGLLACDASEDRAPEAEPGEPLPGLSAAEMESFAAGKALFNRAFSPGEGLGPLFNQTRCSSCHDLPTSGGHGAEPVTKASRFDAGEGCDLLRREGGDLLQASVVPALREAGVLAERVPPSATAVTELRPPPLYGLGLVAAVDEADILRRAEPTDRNGDGVTGRVGHGSEGGVGRFGAKGQHGTLGAFVTEALNVELGLTSTAHPSEQLPNGAPLPGGVDPRDEPEVDEDQIDLLTAYVRFLAPTRPEVPESPEDRAVIRTGGRVFEEVGCAVCHVPTMVTGPSEIPSLDRKRFRIYSDLLLHDLGEDLADVCGPGAAPSEWMTSRLVGLRHRTQFLHNRRAQSLEAAILLHGREGAASRSAFRALDEDSREALLRFLRSL